MKPVIDVTCLPFLSEEILLDIHNELVVAIESVKAFGLKGEESMVHRFPMDMMSYGLGDEVVIEGYGFSELFTSEASWKELAYKIGAVLREFFPKAYIQCTVRSIGSIRGIWISPAPVQKEVQHAVA